MKPVKPRYGTWCVDYICAMFDSSLSGFLPEIDIWEKEFLKQYPQAKTLRDKDYAAFLNAFYYGEAVLPDWVQHACNIIYTPWYFLFGRLTYK